MRYSRKVTFQPLLVSVEFLSCMSTLLSPRCRPLGKTFRGHVAACNLQNVKLLLIVLLSLTCVMSARQMLQTMFLQ